MTEPELISQSIRQLLNSWPSQAANLTPEQTGAYFASVRGMRADDVASAVMDFTQGRVDGRNSEFLPPAPTLATRVVEMQRKREAEARAATPRPALPAPPLATFTEEEREQRRAACQKLIDDYKKSHKALVDPMPQDPDKARKRAAQQAFDAMMQDVIDGDPVALAKLKADNASISLSNESRVSLGLPVKQGAA